MIHEVDEALRAWIADDILASVGVEVAFETPNRDWAARRSGPAVNLFLYDVREDLSRRHQGLRPEHDERGMVVARREPPRWFRLSYLITAWTNRPPDEHRLLSTVLTGFLRRDTLPVERFTGSLADLALAVPVTVALPPDETRALAEVWNAMGGELKASLDLVVVAPIATARLAVGPPVTDGMRVRVDDLARDRDAETAGGSALKLRYEDDAEPGRSGARAEVAVGVRRRRGAPAERQGRR